jgi:hypothetical protein
LGDREQQDKTAGRKPILFIGTSFLGAVKQGWQAVHGPDGALFVGFDAPMFIKNIGGVQLQGRRLRFPRDLDVFGYAGQADPNGSPEPAQSDTFADSLRTRGADVALGRVRAVVFVDMFFRHTPPLAVDASGGAALHGIPVSDAALRAMQMNFFNGAGGLRNHKRYGSVSITSCLPLIAAVRDAVAAPVIVLGCPRPPRSNLKGDWRADKARFDYIDRFYDAELGEKGIRYVGQPADLLDSDQCATPDHFSRGAHKFQQAALDPHMNSEFGAILLRSALADLA